MGGRWHDYTGSNRPATDGIYLVILRKEEGLALGFGDNNPIYTARYTLHKTQFDSIGMQLPIPDLDGLVIAWGEILPIAENANE